MTRQIARLTQALVLALTAPDAARQDAADALVQQLAYGMPQDEVRITAPISSVLPVTIECRDDSRI